MHFTSELETHIFGKSSLNRVCRQFLTALVEPGKMLEQTC